MTTDSPCHTNDFEPARLASIRTALQGFVGRGELAGVVTLTSKSGKVVQSEAIGLSDLEAGRPMRPDTLFRIASMTKPVTSAALLMLMEEGKLGLNDPVARWVPELAGRQVLLEATGPLDAVTPAKREITIEDLLTHRSGIAYAPFSEGPIKQAYERALGDPVMNRSTPDEWLSALGTLPLVHQPGERFHYGHSTDVLGFLIGRVEGKPFRQVLKERIFEPLGMLDTDFWLPMAKRHRLAKLYGYDDQSGKLREVELDMYDQPPDYTPGGGGLISSAPDYHKFACMLLAGGSHNNVQLLRPETVHLMRTNRLTVAQRQVPFAGMPLWQKSGFGLGLAIAENLADNPYAVGAEGAVTWPGVYGTWWQADPANDLVLIYLVQHHLLPSAHSAPTTATGAGAAGRRALPIYQRGIYSALRGGGSAAEKA